MLKDPSFKNRLQRDPLYEQVSLQSKSGCHSRTSVYSAHQVSNQYARSRILRKIAARNRPSPVGNQPDVHFVASAVLLTFICALSVGSARISDLVFRRANRCRARTSPAVRPSRSARPHLAMVSCSSSGAEPRAWSPGRLWPPPACVGSNCRTAPDRARRRNPAGSLRPVRRRRYGCDLNGRSVLMVQIPFGIKK